MKLLRLSSKTYSATLSSSEKQQLMLLTVVLADVRLLVGPASAVEINLSVFFTNSCIPAVVVVRRFAGKVRC